MYVNIKICIFPQTCYGRERKLFLGKSEEKREVRLAMVMTVIEGESPLGSDSGDQAVGKETHHWSSKEIINLQKALEQDKRALHKTSLVGILTPPPLDSDELPWNRRGGWSFHLGKKEEDSA